MYYNKIPIYPTFYLLKGDYTVKSWKGVGSELAALEHYRGFTVQGSSLRFLSETRSVCSILNSSTTILANYMI